jgi:hypothetical protein
MARRDAAESCAVARSWFPWLPWLPMTPAFQLLLMNPRTPATDLPTGGSGRGVVSRFRGLAAAGLPHPGAAPGATAA